MTHVTWQQPEGNPPGGKALNQAVALARLGAQVTAVGVVGDDGCGNEILTALSREGIDNTFTVTATNDIGTGMAGQASTDTCAPLASESFSDSDTAAAQAFWTDAEAASAADYNRASLDTAVTSGQVTTSASPLPDTGECAPLALTPGTTSAGGGVPQDPAASRDFDGYPDGRQALLLGGSCWPRQLHSDGHQ